MYEYSKPLQKARQVIKKDKRVGRTHVSCYKSYILLESSDGFHLTIAESALPNQGPLYFTGNGDTYYGTYDEITHWIDRHEKYLGGTMS